MKIVLLGPPGAGKGSLAGLLKDQFHLAHISTGDMLREEMKKGSALGVQIKALVEDGSLVSDEIVTKLVEQKIAAGGSAMARGFMLDGFPRTEAQAQTLDVMLEKAQSRVDFALYLDVAMEVVLSRLTGRRVCKSCGALYHVSYKPPRSEGRCDLCQGPLYQRADDNEETIRHRMDVYYASTQPIIDYYAKQGKLKKLDANVDTADLCAFLVKTLDENKPAHNP